MLLASMLGSGGISSHRSLKEFASCQGCPGALLFVLHSIFNLFISFHSPFLEFLGCFVCSCQSGVGMGWRNTLCFVSCAALAVVMPSKVEGKVSRSNSIPLKCHCTLTRGKQPKNTLTHMTIKVLGLPRQLKLHVRNLLDHVLNPIWAVFICHATCHHAYR